MFVAVDRTISRLRNTRDLQAAIVSLAAELADRQGGSGRLTVVDPAIRPDTVHREWERLLRALDPAIRSRMRLDVEQRDPRRWECSSLYDSTDAIPLDRPNYRYEVLRLLLGASLTPFGADSLKGLIDRIGASQTPIREAIIDLKRAGIIQVSGRRLCVLPGELTRELLARMGAFPQTLRFRFERGAQIRSPKELVERALPLLASTDPKDKWVRAALSGVPVALADIPQLDLMGTPRLDLVVHVPRGAKLFDGGLLHRLDQGLELEPSILAPAPVAVTLVRAKDSFFRVANLEQVRCASPADIFLALLDMGFRDQALQYALDMRT